MDARGAGVHHRVWWRVSQNDRIAHYGPVSGHKGSQSGAGRGINRIDGAVPGGARSADDRVTIIGREQNIARRSECWRRVNIPKIRGSQHGPSARINFP